VPRVAEHSVVHRLPNQNILAVRHQESSDVSDSDIVIRMLSAGVCGTDLAMLSGSRACRAQVLGHEGVGVVLHTPPDGSVPQGARVIINPVHRNCPEIVIGHSRDGIFRELFCLDAAHAMDGDLLVRCPDGCSVADAELALTEPLASALYSLELLREKCGTASLLIRGSGTIGILAAKLWATLTGESAIVLSKSEAHAQWLRESTRWPAKVRVCCANEFTPIRERSQGSGCGAAILCCSRQDAPQGLRLLLDIVPEGATIDLMAGFPADYREARIGGVNLDGIRWNHSCGAGTSSPIAVADSLTGKTIYLMGHRGTAQRHILQAVDLLSRRIISIADVPHRLISLGQLPEAVQQMVSTTSRPHTKFVKAIVDFSRDDRGNPTSDC
jgi:threonine dehydrogenase-like Zn-dependent dehydrogenase